MEAAATIASTMGRKTRKCASNTGYAVAYRVFLGRVRTAELDDHSAQISEVLALNVKLEVFTAVTMKNAVFWDIKTQFVLHRKH
jgi:hypothetical protein